jgi:hypothetical protein
MAWFDYFDMSSGGKQKTEWEHIYVEADSSDEADVLFETSTGLYPHNITCDCCGEDFVVHKGESLEDVTMFDRKRIAVVPLDVYTARPTVLVLPKKLPPGN